MNDLAGGLSWVREAGAQSLRPALDLNARSVGLRQILRVNRGCDEVAHGCGCGCVSSGQESARANAASPARAARLAWRQLLGEVHSLAALCWRLQVDLRRPCPALLLLLLLLLLQRHPKIARPSRPSWRSRVPLRPSPARRAPELSPERADAMARAGRVLTKIYGSRVLHLHPGEAVSPARHRV